MSVRSGDTDADVDRFVEITYSRLHGHQIISVARHPNADEGLVIETANGFKLFVGYSSGFGDMHLDDM